MCLPSRVSQAFPREADGKLKKLPDPADAVKKVIMEDVYQTHDDSSDEEASQDKLFRERSDKMRKDAISTLSQF